MKTTGNRPLEKPKQREDTNRIGPAVVHGDMGCSQKKLEASVGVPPAPLLVPSHWSVSPSVTSVASVSSW
jgi:hypothetical protein